MPLIIPQLTLGGPADEERQAHYFRRWWDVVNDTLGNPCDDDGLLLQVQVHRAEYLTGTHSILSNIGLGSFVPDPREEMARVRSANGDDDTNPYRIVIKAKPYYFAIATAKTKEEILSDWDFLQLSLKDMRRVESNSQFFALSPRDYALLIVERVLRTKVNQTLNGESRSTVWTQLEIIIHTTDVPSLSREANNLLSELNDPSEPPTPTQALLRNTLLLRARMFRRDHGDDLELAASSGTSSEPVGLPVTMSNSQAQRAFRDLISAQSLDDLHILRDEITALIETRRREALQTSSVPSLSSSTSGSYQSQDQQVLTNLLRTLGRANVDPEQQKDN